MIFQIMTKTVIMTKCICKGNLQKIVEESEPILDTKWEDKTGNIWMFTGVMIASDDYYYGFWNKEFGYTFYSCVGTIEGFGFKQIEK